MRNVESDTIAAIATAPGRGGVGIVRVSGARLQDFARALSDQLPRARHAAYARFHDSTGQVIDEGLLLYFPSPHSYTGEDVLELHAHGGPTVLHMLLQRCLELGARVAEPGEFTRRAFLNDKLDLAQAEAVADLIDASTEAAVRSAGRSLRGEFSAAVNAIVERLIALRMHVEATLDFPEEEIETQERETMRVNLREIQTQVDELLRHARQGSLLRRGMDVVLAGQPNVGKSSLLNRLAGEELAIVTAIAGTTRDIVRQTIQLNGLPVNIIDTAGLRRTEDEVELIGIQRAWREIEQADVLLLLVDARAGITAADEVIVQQLPAKLPRLVVHNKADLVDSTDQFPDTLYVSAKSGAGIDRLRDELQRLAGWHAQSEDVYLARERHLASLRAAREHLRAGELVFGQAEFMAEELRLAQTALNAITGEFTADDLLGEIFSRFCIGK